MQCFKAAARNLDTQPSAPHHTNNLKTKAPNMTGSSHLYNTLELLMMGIMVPETCWASNKICNRNHLLHLVGISFPHINDDARSKPHQTYLLSLLYLFVGCRNKNCKNMPLSFAMSWLPIYRFVTTWGNCVTIVTCHTG